MNELDKAIVAILQTDARTTNREIAAHLKIAPSTCLERVRGLKAKGTITGFHAEVDASRLGRQVQAMISVGLRPQSRKIVESFRDFVADLDETLAVYVVTGDEDVLIHVGVESTTALQNFVLDHLTQRSEISKLSTAVIYEYQRKKVVKPL